MRSMLHTTFRSTGPGLFLAALILCSGCKAATPIKSLMDDPGQYDGQTVRIAGTVTSSLSAFGSGAYQVDDGTGVITVIATEGGAPREGAKVGVKGTFRAAFTLKTETAAVLLEKNRYTE